MHLLNIDLSGLWPVVTWLTVGGGATAIVQSVANARKEARKARGHEVDELEAERRERIAWMEVAVLARRIAVEKGATLDELGPIPAREKISPPD